MELNDGIMCGEASPEAKRYKGCTPVPLFSAPRKFMLATSQRRGKTTPDSDVFNIAKHRDYLAKMKLHVKLLADVKEAIEIRRQLVEELYVRACKVEHSKICGERVSQCHAVSAAAADIAGLTHCACASSSTKQNPVSTSSDAALAGVALVCSPTTDDQKKTETSDSTAACCSEGELNEKPWPAQINSDAIDQGTGRCTGEILGTLKHQTEGNIEEGEEEVRCETQPIAAIVQQQIRFEAIDSNLDEKEKELQNVDGGLRGPHTSKDSFFEPCKKDTGYGVVAFGNFSSSSGNVSAVESSALGQCSSQTASHSPVELVGSCDVLNSPTTVLPHAIVDVNQSLTSCVSPTAKGSVARDGLLEPFLSPGTQALASSQVFSSAVDLTTSPRFNSIFTKVPCAATKVPKLIPTDACRSSPVSPVVFSQPGGSLKTSSSPLISALLCEASSSHGTVAYPHHTPPHLPSATDIAHTPSNAISPLFCQLQSS